MSDVFKWLWINEQKEKDLIREIQKI